MRVIFTRVCVETLGDDGRGCEVEDNDVLGVGHDADVEVVRERCKACEERGLEVSKRRGRGREVDEKDVCWIVEQHRLTRQEKRHKERDECLAFKLSQHDNEWTHVRTVDQT